jgi:hypothetical protein
MTQIVLIKLTQYSYQQIHNSILICILITIYSPKCFRHMCGHIHVDINENTIIITIILGGTYNVSDIFVITYNGIIVLSP